MKPMYHYYGDAIRILFLVAGVIMILTLPFFKNLIPMPVFFSVLALVIIATAAGLTSPTKRGVMILNVFVSLVAFSIFEYYAITQYGTVDPIFFFSNQALAIVFFFTLYYSTKTLRGHFAEPVKTLPPIDEPHL